MRKNLRRLLLATTAITLASVTLVVTERLVSHAILHYIMKVQKEEKSDG